MVENNGDLSVKAELSDEKLENVKGGLFAGKNPSASTPNFQITFQGNNLPMNVVLSSLSESIPEIKGIFGSNYNTYKSYTLNQLCTTFGESTIQGYFNDYSREGK